MLGTLIIAMGQDSNLNMRSHSFASLTSHAAPINKQGQRGGKEYIKDSNKGKKAYTKEAGEVCDYIQQKQRKLSLVEL